MEVNSTISKFLPLHFLHKDSYFLCSILCAEKSEIVVEGTQKSAFAIRSRPLYPSLPKFVTA